MVKLLDCTLRDGGYINDWKFGEQAIVDISSTLVNSNVDIVELGFLKDEAQNKDRTVFNSVKQFVPLIKEKKKNTLYAAMIDVQGRIPIEMVEPCTPDTVDVIRVIVWKRLLDSDFEYCKKIAEKGYKLCVQPARVDQYSEEEFVSMIRRFETLNPLAIYVVDSWGTLSIKDFLHYFCLMDKNLKQGVSIGYHGHNNMQQAFGIAQALLNSFAMHDLIIDSSIYGIGRGAGNLNTEIIANYLNSAFNANYNIENILQLYYKYIKEIYDVFPWGYSIPLFATAMKNCNPEYGVFLQKKNIAGARCLEFINGLSGDNKIRYNKEFASSFVESLAK